MVMMLSWTMAVADAPVAQIFDAAAVLLTDTSNVTLTGSATFSLDGEPFKFVETTYVQDGVNSKWVLNLSSPRGDGSMRENGFTAIANNRHKYGMEVFQPGVYRAAEDDPQSVILRPSAELSQMISLGHGLMELIPAWPEDVFSYTEGGQLQVRLEKEQIPDAASNLISLAVLLAVQRTTNIVDDSIAVPPYPEEANAMADYITPTQGIICCTEKYELTELSVDAQLDAENRFTEVNGTARFTLHTFLEGPHDLHISFAGTASDYGTSKVPAFDAAEFGVQPAEGTYIPLDDMSGADADPEVRDSMIDKARDYLEKAGYPHLDEETWKVSMQSPEQYRIIVRDEDATLLTMNLSSEGGLLLLQDDKSWFDVDLSIPFTIHDDESIRQETVEKLIKFLRETRPELIDKFSGNRFDWGIETENGAYVYMIESWPISVDGSGVSFIVQASPEWKIMYFDCISNG